jgi:hypothetical protein
MVAYKSVKSYLRTFPWLRAVHDAGQSGGVERGITGESSEWPGEACNRNYAYEYSAWLLHF